MLLLPVLTNCTYVWYRRERVRAPKVAGVPADLARVVDDSKVQHHKGDVREDLEERNRVAGLHQAEHYERLDWQRRLFLLSLLLGW